MSRLGRLRKLEKQSTSSGNKEITTAVVFVGDKNWREREAQIKESYLEKHGTLDGLLIYKSWVPEPLPLPDEFQ